MDFILQGGVPLALIYLSVEFGIIWISPSAGPNSWPSASIEQDVPVARGLDMTVVLIAFGLHYIYSSFGCLFCIARRVL
jgi:hypothetical protein